MTNGDISAAVTVVRTIREDWDRRATEGQITELAGGNYTHPDVLWVCATIALDRNNRSPVTLTMKAEELLERLHSKTAVNRTPGPRKREDGYLCDECGLTQDRCQSQASNLDGRDHPFRSIAQRDHAREQMHADGRIAAARDEALAKAPANLFKLPDDIASDQTQIQEEAS